jgi:hypothetical protein
MGLKPQYMPMREIVALAEEYLAAHRAVLAAEAKVVVDKWTAEGFLESERLSFESEATATRAFLLNEYHAHNSPTSRGYPNAAETATGERTATRRYSGFPEGSDHP